MLWFLLATSVAFLQSVKDIAFLKLMRYTSSLISFLFPPYLHTSIPPDLFPVP